MIGIWANCLIAGTMTWDRVPARRRPDVIEELRSRSAEEKDKLKERVEERKIPEEVYLEVIAE